MNAGHRLAARFTAAVALAGLVRVLVMHLGAGDGADLSALYLCAIGLQFGLLGLLQGWSLSGYGFNRAGLLALCSMATVLPWFLVIRFGPSWILSGSPEGLSHGLIQGVSLGLLQLPLLWRHLRPAVLWPVATTAAWTAGALVMASGTQALRELGVEGAALTGAIDVLASMTIGGISGIAALKLALPGDTNDPARRVDETGQEHRR